MGSNLNDLKRNTDNYIKEKLYTNLMVTLYQKKKKKKPLTNVQRLKRKKSKCVTKENHQTITEKDKKGTEKSSRNDHTGNKMAINTYQQLF